MTNLVYQQAAAELRQRIAAGDYDQKTGLPTEAELCASLGVSRSSLRRALDILREEGLVVSRQGSGWSVIPTLTAARVGVRAVSEPSTATSSVSELVGHRMTKPPDSVAELLGATEISELFMIERVSKIGSAVVHRSETWFSPAVSSAVDLDVAISRPPALLLHELGYELGPFDQFVEAVLSNDRDEELIGLPGGSAVLQVVRTAHDASGSALFQSLHRHPGPSTRIDIDLPTTNNPNAGSVSLSLEE